MALEMVSAMPNVIAMANTAEIVFTTQVPDLNDVILALRYSLRADNWRPPCVARHACPVQTNLATEPMRMPYDSVRMSDSARPDTPAESFMVLRTALTLALTLMCPFAHAADVGKTLRPVFQIAETSFDPQFASDAASDRVIDSIYESMLDYDYLARPIK